MKSCQKFLSERVFFTELVCTLEIFLFFPDQINSSTHRGKHLGAKPFLVHKL